MIKAFVSSTYRDLREHRAYVIERLQRGGIHVDPMEMWTAASDEPKELSQERVRDCDLCILLVGFRRGYISEGETLSITQLEYREALRLGMDVLVFIAQEAADWKAEAMAELKTDPELINWRAELMEHYVVSFFTPLPGSVNVDSAVLRWLGENQKRAEKIHSEKDEGYSIDVRAYSNVETNLVVWRTEKPIPECLGFVLQRKLLSKPGIIEQIGQNRLGFASTEPAFRPPAPGQPMQNFRWADRIPPGEEARYRVVPVLGMPGELHSPEDATLGSSWTGWISSQNRQTPQFQFIFNVVYTRLSALGYPFYKTRDDLLQKIRKLHSPERDTLGGSLLSTLLELLGAALKLDQRIHIAVPDLDDNELVEALSALGENLHIMLGDQSIQVKQRNQIVKKLVHNGVKVYSLSPCFQYRFMVISDRWGMPSRVWMGSGEWTTESLCLRGNHALLVDSTHLARLYLDRWESMRDAADPLFTAPRYRKTRPEQINSAGISLTLWNTPASAEADLRDIRRLIRGAREGVLFLLHSRQSKHPILDEILAIGQDDLFVQGIYNIVRSRGNGNFLLFDPFIESRHLVDVRTPLDSNLIVIDPFGPHPVVISGAPVLGAKTKEKEKSDLLIVENAPGLATECAIHIIRIFEYHRFQSIMIQSTDRTRFIGLQPDDKWQQRYFEKVKRSEFNFFFGSLWPGMD